jgi:hypothetical protein
VDAKLAWVNTLSLQKKEIKMAWMYPIEHDYNTEEERKAVESYIDNVLGLDYEVTESDAGGGSIVIFEMEPREYSEFAKWLKDRGFVKGDSSEN